MRSAHTALALLSAAILFLAASIAVPRGTVEIDPAANAEVARIQRHLERVERELLARDVSHLSPAARAARARSIGLLREYRERGIFPHNHDFPGERVPYFVDEHGTLCAMAYLIARSGRPDLVQRIAATRNNARIAELADDPELAAWLETAGLTLAEAARIQPKYDCCPAAEPETDAVDAEYAVASTLTGLAGGAAITLNLGSGEETGRGAWWRGGLGLAAGATGIALGAGHLDEAGSPRVLGAVNLGIGIASAALGIRTLVAGRPSAAARRGGDASGARLSLGMALLPRGRAAARPGVFLHLHF